MRLIDADRKWEETECESNGYKMEYYSGIFSVYDKNGTCICEFMPDLPTAYDIDKVVNELEIRVNEANNNCLCEMHENGHTIDFENENGRIKGLKDAIEIVKQGCSADDVCEWKQTSTAKYKTSCGYKLEEYFDTKACFCKQCGKKIKVVE